MTEKPQAPVTIEDLMRKLEDLCQEHGDLWKAMVTADGGNVFPMDLYVQGVLNRSSYLLAGFATLIRDGNYHCAASLVRLHLDNALRLSAAWQVSDPHAFARAVMGGTSIRDLTDRHGKKLTDAHLAKNLDKDYPWVKRVYDTTCQFVHLSGKHMFQGFRLPDDEQDPGTFTMGMDIWRSPVADEAIAEGLECMIAITEIVLQYVAGWVMTKDQARRGGPTPLSGTAGT